MLRPYHPEHTPYTFLVSASHFGRSTYNDVTLRNFPKFRNQSGRWCKSALYSQKQLPQSLAYIQVSVSLSSPALWAADNTRAVARNEKSQIRLLTDLPYVAPPDATPEGQQLSTSCLQENFRSKSSALISATGSWSKPFPNA